jgi:ATP-dependent DNA helicase RecQ
MANRAVVFFDTEVSSKSNITDVGAIADEGSTFHKPSIAAFSQFLNDTRFICGHNILHHDLKYLNRRKEFYLPDAVNVIDTLYWSPLLFPKRPYHKLLKDDKLQKEEPNNPLNDAIKARDLFNDEVAAFNELDDDFKDILYLLLQVHREFNGLLSYLSYSAPSGDTAQRIRHVFANRICTNANIDHIINQNPIELAYALALLSTGDKYSIVPPWVVKSFPDVERVNYLLRGKPCISGCAYCNQSLDAKKGLKHFFGFDEFRTFEGKPLQEHAAAAAVKGKSILAVFPTGGGKSITFQVPALMSGQNERGLTVVISPLQSLMKDQVDNLEKKGITDSATINGLLDPVERAKSMDRVENGLVSILYIAPESLRSKTIERLLLGRNVVRFVVDEAHCFSSWGHDFRVDYQYIGDFIKLLQEKKNLSESIPVSCFTATAKQNVIEDIRDYFKEKLDLDLELFTASVSRKNLHYRVIPKEDDEKYQMVRDLIDQKNCPTIVYVSRTKRAYEIAQRLASDGVLARPYHGKMDAKDKTTNQNAFIAGDIDVIVATSAFGMGVDKDNVGMVIHYDISDSLENYVQEAGRAGRDQRFEADCYVLFSEEDLSKHFVLLNQTKLSIKEIQQVWRAIKGLTKFRNSISNSALEIARKAGWDDTVQEIETRVTTAIAALENAGYLKRGQNEPRVFANSILSKTAQEAIDKINGSRRFDDKQKVKAVRIIKSLFSSKSRKYLSDENAESRVDYISDRLGIVKEEVIRIINLLREEEILADAKDLTAFIKSGENKNQSLKRLKQFLQLETILLEQLSEEESKYNQKELNEQAQDQGCTTSSPDKIKSLINYWAIKNWVKRHYHYSSKHHFTLKPNQPLEELKLNMDKRRQLAGFIVEYLFDKSTSELTQGDEMKPETLVEFSVHELKTAYEKSNTLFSQMATLDEIEDTLFYLSRIEAIKIEGGFLVVYNRLSIKRLEENNRRLYKTEDYKKLEQFYENRVQQIHIVGEYAKKMIDNYKGAVQFIEDYFQLNYSSFLRKYFNGREDELNRNITRKKFDQLFGELATDQLTIIKDNKTKIIVVAAGPGSGKTKLLVHKLASLLLMEDIKHEQLLMLTFSRAAATEFKKRLIKLIGGAANFIEIKTFHSYCFDLLGKNGDLEKSQKIISDAVEKINRGEVELNRITKTVLVIDEAQDMDKHEYALVQALLSKNDEMRVVAVGDDDQNIYEFRGANSAHLFDLLTSTDSVKYELPKNYRSAPNLVEYTNQFVSTISNRLKSVPVIAHKTERGRLKITKYTHHKLMVPTVQSVANTSLAGTSCILTKTNAEAYEIVGLLHQKGIRSRLIQTNDTFNLINLLEVRFFLNQIKPELNDVVIPKETWNQGYRSFRSRHKESPNFDVVKNMLVEFHKTNPRTKYKSDLEVFIRESKFEDFISTKQDVVAVSTMHKAKGKEFDNVFLMLQSPSLATDQDKRLLYVAMTRAKQNLFIHTNSSFFDHFVCEGLERHFDNQVYMEPEKIVFQLSHKDLWLDYFMTKQHLLNAIEPGQDLNIVGNASLSANGKPILQFSKKFQKEIASLHEKGYFLKSVTSNFIVYWRKEALNKEFKIVLPLVEFEKS